MTSTYAPSTLFRSYNADKSQHNTAVQLKSGEVRETKNADGSARANHPSYDAWLAARQFADGSVVVDAKNARGVVVGSDTHGFAYDKHAVTRYNSLLWTNWCYEMILECAPALLTNDSVRTAFNHFVELCKKYDSNINGIHSYLFTSDRRYQQERLCNNKIYKDFDGFPARWLTSNYSYVYSIPEKDKDSVKELSTGYTALLTLIQSDLTTPMRAKLQRAVAERKVKDVESRIRWIQKKVQKHMDIMEGWKAALETAKKNLEALTH